MSGATPTETRTAVMAALELALDVAYHDGTPRELAVVAVAWSHAGYALETADITHVSQPDLMAAIAAARRGRHRRLLRAEAHALVAAFEMLAAEELISYSSCAEARRVRWARRGGHARRHSLGSQAFSARVTS